MGDDTIKGLVMRYFESWPNGDFEMMRDCLSDKISFNGQTFAADPFCESASKGPRWTNVKLVVSVFESARAALLYEGTETDTGQVMRVGEFITADNGKITRIDAAIAKA